MSERKRRKWDVAAPQGIPLHGNRAGIGMSGSSNAAASAAGGLITAQGLQTAAPPVQQVPSPQTIPSPGTAAKPAQPIDRDTIARAQMGAAAIVAKLNQELAAQGKLPPGKVMSFAKPGEDTATIFRDVYINDAPPDMRHHMTKRPTQDDVARRTGTQVVTRGRYMAPGTPFTDVDKPLHLHTTPGACSSEDEAEQRRCVEAAAAELRQILGGKRLPRGGVYIPGPKPGMGGPPQGFQQPGMPGAAPFNPYSVPPPGVAPAGQPPGGYGTHLGSYGQPSGAFGQQPLQSAIPVIPGVQSTSISLGFEAAPDFNVVQRLKGPNGSYMQHIATETGANITLRGKGSGIQEGDALHIYISSAIPKAFAEAAKLAQNLLDTVKAEHDKQFPYYQPPPSAPAYYAPPPAQQMQQMQRPPYQAAGYAPPAASQQSHHSYAAPQPGQYRPQGAAAAPMPGSYAPPQQMGQRPPYMPGPHQQQQQQYGPPPNMGSYAPPPQQSYPPPDRAGPPSAHGMGPHAGPPGASSAQQESEMRQEEQRRKRFREFKEEKPASAKLQPPPYYAPPPDVQQPRQEPVGFNLPRQEGMGGLMGPPPPRMGNGASAMGPPPPKLPQNPAGMTTGGMGGLGGLVDYGDDD